MKAATKSLHRNRALDAGAAKSARHARLRYVDDSAPGIHRQRRGKSFVYVDARGRPVRSERTLQRIRALVIPPAWKDVWICTAANGHLQATGRDARGRKQFRYHARWRAARDETKYQNVIAFARALPRIRRHVQRDLRRRQLCRPRVLAAIVRLLETTLIRVGNDEYARTNGSFGLTTMRDKHARVKGKTVRFAFRGKSGIRHDVDLSDPRLAKVIRQCQDLPGQSLFQYLDEEEVVRDVTSSDVNEYLREISGHEFTAKDFRTWAGTALAAQALREFEDFDSQAAARRNITRAIERVAERLGNTRTVCRKCYVHPAVIEAYLDHSLLETLKQRTETELRKELPSLPAEEAAVLTLLQQRMKRQLETPARKGRKGRKPAPAAAG